MRALIPRVGLFCCLLMAMLVTSNLAVGQEPAAPAAAGPAGPSTADLKVALDTMWVMIAGFMVFFMNLGFGCVESGFCRAKNCVNILSKNFVVFAVSTMGFWAIGFGLMFGNGSPFIGQSGLWFASGLDNSPAIGPAYSGDYGALNWTGVPLAAKFFFQLVFAGTAATIVSGAVAERIKYLSFIIFSLLISVFIYPVVGHWIWGGGFLAAGGFFDFAGSTQVHSIGGWCALTGILFLGPRKGKFGPDGKAKAIPGHSMMAAFIGCLVLWFGWFGFNPGSTMAADPGAIADVALTTNLAAAIATITATATSWIILGKPDIGMTLNGCLAGLVAITAPCAFVTPFASVIIGAIAGVLVVLAVLTFDKLKIDDPVGATSVHLVNGVFGTLCVGLFADPKIVGVRIAGAEWGGLFYGKGADQLMIQLKGVGATAIYCLIVSSICWAVIKYTIGLRVKDEEEVEGLDVGEHGNEAYHGFVLARTGEFGN
ncbi:MAG: ammonium transporter [Planctomycetaceae bacterium]|nr:ammonium transporter [Planctomycetaceae bacterium]